MECKANQTKPNKGMTGKIYHSNIHYVPQKDNIISEEDDFTMFFRVTQLCQTHIFSD